MAAETEDLLREMDNLRNSLNGLSGSASSAASSSSALDSRLKALGDSTKKASSELTRGLGSFASSVSQGNTNLSQFNQVVGAATGAAGTLGNAASEAGKAMMGTRNIFANILGGAAIGLGVTITGLSKATAAAATVILSQSDALAKNYSDISRMGGLTAEGMTGLSNQVINSGLALEQFRNVISENSTGLAAFKGTVGEGATALFDVVGKLSKSFQEVDGKIVPVNQEFAELQGQLRYLGFGAEQIAEASAGFVKNQTLLGRQELITRNSLIKSTVDYALELDTVAKLTGANRKQIQKNQEAALRESRYSANLEIARRRYGDNTAELIDQVQRTLSNIEGMEDMAKGFRDNLGGLNTELGRQAARSIGSNDVINKIRSGEIKTREQALAELQNNAAKTVESNRNLAGTATEAYEKVFGNFAGTTAFSKMSLKAGQALVKGSQTAAKDGLDPLTKSVTAAQQSMEFLNTQLFKLTLDFVPLASDAVQAFAKAAGVAAAEIRQLFTGKSGGTPESAGPAQKKASDEFRQAEQALANARKEREEQIKSARESGASPAEIKKIEEQADAKVDAARKEHKEKLSAALKESAKATRATMPTGEEQSKLNKLNSQIKDSYSTAEDLKAKLETVKKVSESAGMKVSQSKDALEWKKKQADLEKQIADNDKKTLELQEQYKATQKEVQENINKRKEALQKEPVAATQPAAAANTTVNPVAVDVNNPMIATQPAIRSPLPPKGTAPAIGSPLPPKGTAPASRSIMSGPQSGPQSGPGTVPGNDLFGLGKFSGPASKSTSPGTVNISDLLDFNSGQYGSGSMSNFEKLNSSIKNSVIEAAKQYKNDTNKKLQITSSWRDYETQKNLYLDYINGKSSFPAAKPGTSDHESGLAIDIGTLNPMSIKALNTQGLFQRVPNDPVHFTKEFGGVVSGPISGYRGVLHGPEAVVPLPGGRNIPVEMPRFTNALEEQSSLMKSMISSLNEVVEVIKTGNRTSKNILQITRS